jgi:hypothetical protein
MTYSIDSILEEYKENNCAAFAIYEGKERRAIYEGNEIDEGEEKISKFLNRIAVGSFKVKLYKSVPKGGIDDKTPVLLSLPFEKKYTQEEKNTYWEGRGLGGDMLMEIRSLKNELSLLKDQINTQTDEEIEEESQPQNFLAGLVSNPDVQNLITGLLTNVGVNLLSKQVAPNKMQPMAMAGIDFELEDIIQSLIDKGVTIDDFKKLNDMPNEKLSFLLNMLKAS